jgi:hypothetical protein
VNIGRLFARRLGVEAKRGGDPAAGDEQAPAPRLGVGPLGEGHARREEEPPRQLRVARDRLGQRGGPVGAGAEDAPLFHPLAQQ